jgi:hypothetical protein
MTCSGTLVDEDLVLTAHHCVVRRGPRGEFTKELASARDLRIELGGDYLAWGHVAVAAIVAPPDAPDVFSREDQEELRRRERNQMCGIVAYVGSKDCVPILVEGLRRLEYRGYDSAGLAVQTGRGLSIVRAVGKLANLDAALRKAPLQGTTGIGHTRWATHGRPSEANAHPHVAGQSRSSTTGSSRTTSRCGASSRPEAYVSRATPTPRSSRT